MRSVSLLKPPKIVLAINLHYKSHKTYIFLNKKIRVLLKTCYDFFTENLKDETCRAVVFHPKITSQCVTRPQGRFLKLETLNDFLCIL